MTNFSENEIEHEMPISEDDARTLVERIEMAFAFTLTHQYDMLTVALPVCKCATAKPFMLCNTEDMHKLMRFVIATDLELAKKVIAECEPIRVIDKEVNSPSSNARN
jgi:hypothetical protein